MYEGVKKSLTAKIDLAFLFFCTAILLPVFGEMLYFYSVCNESSAGFAVFSFFICFNLLLQIQCCLNSQSTLPNRGYKYALLLIFISLMFVIPFFALSVIIYRQTGNSDTAVTASMLYIYAFSAVIGIVFIVITKFYREKIKIAIVIATYVVFISSCIICSVFADRAVYNIDDKTPVASAEELDFDWTDDETPEQLSVQLGEFYEKLMKADASYTVSEELSPVRNVGMLYRINSVSNIKAVVFEGLGYAGQRTKVFAYVGIPKHASAQNKAPAVVLIHGAGGTASYSWVKQWVDRGYAAIAVSIFGSFPDSDRAMRWSRELPLSLFEQGSTVAPNIDGMANSSERMDIQWMYHAVGQAILADSIIRSFDWVDSEKVGLCGISWGAVVASVAMTYDTRFSFAIPIFGSAYLQGSEGILSQCYEGSTTNTIWAAENRLSQVKIPVLWICGNNDVFFSPESLSSSYVVTRENNINTQLSFISSATHSHSYARTINEVYAFADSVLNREKTFPYLLNQPSGRSFNIGIKSPNGFSVSGARLYYLTDDWQIENGKFASEWHTEALDVSNNTISCTVPVDCVAYYIDINFNNGRSVYNISSEYIRLAE